MYENEKKLRPGYEKDCSWQTEQVGGPYGRESLHFFQQNWELFANLCFWSSKMCVWVYLRLGLNLVSFQRAADEEREEKVEIWIWWVVDSWANFEARGRKMVLLYYTIIFFLITCVIIYCTSTNHENLILMLIFTSRFHIIDSRWSTSWYRKCSNLIYEARLGFT